ncbi:YdeI/OmpD-associated family protein [Mucilaginibacter myungsuensis]|uniref:YdeI/OmpD-associated family protein n=1 Tax=Mucilaginibacter myungsuensis TaxID=649104 RepID=A0A929PX17_9SPHI|nr:YdeI/OmpD-associated family protein [Mucilaginibacter myungsuensis]MBE9662719.1 YdeI/OmpD-associated family protein [Mucilaginibacter myungsuensis]MDN3598139.1 YdeI/OmpD-associated family protein [Mucilaginibacter myungsuensis]
MNALAKKLQMKAGSRWLLYNAPANYSDMLDPLPEGASTSFAIEGEFDGVQLFVKNSTELSENLKVIVPVLKLKKETIFWVIYPKKSSNIPSDLEMMSSWGELGTYGLTGVAAAGVDATWTALRFRPIELSKIADTRNEEIQKNEYSEYIDVVNKQIKLPEEIAEALEKFPAAMAAYQSLSYSNRKEYVLWILTAKQEKTRLDRLTKMVEKLLLGKKNPAEK